MTRADAFYEIGKYDGLLLRNGRAEFEFAYHADFENYLSGKKAANDFMETREAA